MPIWMPGPGHQPAYPPAQMQQPYLVPPNQEGLRRSSSDGKREKSSRGGHGDGKREKYGKDRDDGMSREKDKKKPLVQGRRRWGENLTAAGLGGAAVSLLSVLSEAAEGL